VGNDLRALVGKGRSFGMKNVSALSGARFYRSLKLGEVLFARSNALSRRCGIDHSHLLWNAYR
jgi:hypothetical protein